MTDTMAPEEPRHKPSDAHGVWTRLYRGETSFDFVGRRRRWFLISATIILIGIISLFTRGLNLGIDFKGGTSWQVPSATLSTGQVQDAAGSVGLGAATVEVLGNGAHRTIEVQDNLGSLSQAAKNAKETQVSSKLASLAHVPFNQVSLSDVGPSWGGDITTKAVRALIVFLAAIAVYISFRFEWKMAIAALVALFHDIILTVGIYSLSGFQVTPATVIAFLTILGYSLYDTIVVFDRVQENTRGIGASGKVTYSEVVNLSMNQTLARSVNTTLVAILPILSVLLIGAQLLGATTLQEFGLALFIGLSTGAYSSIFIASPLLALIKEREGRYATIRQRLEARGDSVGMLTPSGVAARGLGGGAAARSTNGAGLTDGRPEPRRTPPRPPARRPPAARSGTRRPPPRPRKKGKRR